MASSGSPALDKLYRLDTSSPDFGGQLSGLLYGEEYAHCALNFKGDDLIWLIDYLDKVSLSLSRSPFPASHLNKRRLSMS